MAHSRSPAYADYDRVDCGVFVELARLTNDVSTRLLRTVSDARSREASIGCNPLATTGATVIYVMTRKAKSGHVTGGRASAFNVRFWPTRRRRRATNCLGQLADVERELASLAETAARGGAVPVVLAALAKRQQDRQGSTTRSWRPRTVRGGQIGLTRSRRSSGRSWSTGKRSVSGTWPRLGTARNALGAPDRV